MPPPTWAFQVENFNPPPDEELICSICRCVFCDPVECPCHHVFCTACISKWLNVHRNCPICRKRTNESSLHPVVPLIKNMIMKMTLKCPNASNGCATQMTLESCESHINNCLFALVECGNGCGKSFFRRDLVKHETEECPLRCIECRKCQLKIKGSLDQHNCITALKQVIYDHEKELEVLQKRVEELKGELNKRSRRRPAGYNSSFSGGFWSSCFDTSSASDAESARSNISGHLMNQSSSDSSDSDSTDYFREIMNENSGHTSSSISWSSSESNNEESPVTINMPTNVIVMNSAEGSPGDNGSDSTSSGEITVKRTMKRRLRGLSPSSSDSSDNSDGANGGTRKAHRASPSEAPGEADLPSSGSVWGSAASGPSGAVASCSVTEQEAVPSTSYSSGKKKQKATRKPVGKKKPRSGPNTRASAKRGCSPPEHSDQMATSSAQGGASEADSPSVGPQRLVQRIFERTLSLLEQHHLESDSDWVPQLDNDESSSSSSGPESFDLKYASVTNTDSDSSYEVKVPATTYELLER